MELQIVLDKDQFCQRRLLGEVLIHWVEADQPLQFQESILQILFYEVVILANNFLACWSKPVVSY